MKQRIWAGGCLLAALVVSGTAAQADVLFTDNFNRTAGVNAAGSAGGLSSWGTNNNATISSLTGTLTQTYKVRDTATGTSTEQQFVDGNLGRLRLGHGVLDFDLLSDANVLQNGYNVTFDFQRGGGGYIAFALGLTPTQIQTHPQNNARIGVPFSNLIPETDFGFLFRPSAATEVWKAGTSAVGPASFFNAGSITGSPTTLLNSAVVNVTPATPGAWGAGATINLSLVVNSGTPYTTTFTSDGSGLGYFGFHSNAGATVAQAGIDNLVVSSIVAAPEPGSLALIGVGLLGLGGIWRRRK
jgi:hypothetical protein